MNNKYIKTYTVEVTVIDYDAMLADYEQSVREAYAAAALEAFEELVRPMDEALAADELLEQQVAAIPVPYVPEELLNDPDPTETIEPVYPTHSFFGGAGLIFTGGLFDPYGAQRSGGFWER